MSILMVKHPYVRWLWSVRSAEMLKHPQLVDPPQLSLRTYALLSKLTSQPLIPLNGYAYGRAGWNSWWVVAGDGGRHGGG
jgi:hypothetical protein